MKTSASVSTRKLQVIAIYLVASLLVGCIATRRPTTEPGWLTFNSPDIANLIIDYPSDWSALRFSNGNRGDNEVVAILHAPGILSFPNVTIVRRPMTSPTLADVAEWGESRILALNNEEDDEFELFQLNDVNVGSEAALSREYIMDTETPLPLKKQDIYIATESDAVIITFSDRVERYDETIQLFQHMLSTYTAAPNLKD